VEFAWDEEKNRINKRKHGVSFETASLIFDDPHHLTRQDREVDGEPRWQTIGVVHGIHVPGRSYSRRSSLIQSSLIQSTSTTKRSALSQHEKQLAAKGAYMRKASRITKVKGSPGRGLTPRQKRELAALAALPDDQIDTSDIPEPPPSAWKDAVRGRFYRPVKQAVSMRLDADVVAWLKKRGKGYQTRVNGILRQTMMTDIKRG
jgi:uncharacterized protein (DUF4415 family)